MNWKLPHIALTSLAAFALVFAGAGAATAQDGNDDGANIIYSTDRPQETRTPDVIDHEELQLEFGLGFATGAGSADIDTFTIPNALLRWGAHEDFEVRVGLPSYVDISNGSSNSGIGDSSLGLKWGLSDRREAEDQTGVSLLANTTLPTGDDDITGNDDLDPSLALQVRGNNPEGWELGAELEGSWPSTNNDRDFVFSPSVITQGTVGTDLDAFVELSANIADDVDDTTTLSGGIKYSGHENGQFDLGLGVGLNDDAPDFEVDVGYSILFN